MAACEIRVGFFTLEPCRRPTDALCTRCLRAACAEHLMHDGPGLCVECAAEQREGIRTVQPRGELDLPDSVYELLDTLSFFRYRGGYYRSHSYDPSAAWDGQDQQAFVAGPAAPGEADWDDADGTEPSALDS